jgi:hypothetical protein
MVETKKGSSTMGNRSDHTDSGLGACPSTKKGEGGQREMFRRNVVDP